MGEILRGTDLNLTVFPRSVIHCNGKFYRGWQYWANRKSKHEISIEWMAYKNEMFATLKVDGEIIKEDATVTITTGKKFPDVLHYYVL